MVERRLRLRLHRHAAEPRAADDQRAHRLRQGDRPGPVRVPVDARAAAAPEHARDDPREPQPEGRRSRASCRRCSTRAPSTPRRRSRSSRRTSATSCSSRGSSKAIKFAEAPVRGASVLKYDPKGNAADYYRAARRGGSDQWRVVSGPACARARSPTSSARRSIPTIRPRRRRRSRAREDETGVMREQRSAPPPPEPERRSDPPAATTAAPFDHAEPSRRREAPLPEPDPEVRAYRSDDPPAAKERLSRIFADDVLDVERPRLRPRRAPLQRRLPRRHARTRR